MTDNTCKAGIANCKCSMNIRIAEGVYLCFIRIPAGEFMMGSRGYSSAEDPMHRVVISRDFYLGTTPVTQQQARVMMSGAGIEHENHFEGHDQRPAEQVSAQDADKCCLFLKQLLAEQEDGVPGLPDDWRGRCDVRLPSEAEWEYACKSGSDDHLEYQTGDGAVALSQAGWFAHGENYGDNKGNSEGGTHDVATREPSVTGLYDMHGNVSEWCRDAWNDDAYRRRPDGIIDPVVTGPEDAERVLRGGSWITQRPTAALLIASGTYPATGSGSAVFGWGCFRSVRTSPISQG